ncbi:MAG: DUF2779 domain-containing protein [Bacteroidota bacterium]
MYAPFQLSKSTFMYGCQCPKRLYLHKKHKHLSNPEDEKQEAVFAAGTDSGLLARQLFPDGVDASPPDAFQYALAAKNTQAYLATHFVIYEATFIYDGVMCAIDILVRKDNQWYAFEVKGTNSAKPQHITDAALQYAVITGSGLELADFSIVHFNKSYVRKGEIDVQQLFSATSVINEVWREQDAIIEKIGGLKATIAQPDIPEVPVGPQCIKPYPCNFTTYCFRDIEVEETPDIKGEIQVFTEPLKGFMEDIRYPLHFFDFETMMYGVPQFDDSSPWQQLPFQYSLHIQQTETSKLEHRFFLGDGVADPRGALLQQMLTDLGTKGTILVYYKPFEIGRLKELAILFPLHKAAIENIVSRIVDLIVPFKKGMVKIPATQGSNSIKDVLPALVPELSYQTLNIQEGGTASFKYTQLGQMNPIDQHFTQQDLLAYCEMDTLAMVKIWEWLRSSL